MPNHKKHSVSSVPGFIVDSRSFEWFFKHNSLPKKIDDLISTVHFDLPESVMQVSTHIQKLIHDSKFPHELKQEIEKEYKKLGGIFRRTTVLVGIEKKHINNPEELFEEIKNIWAANFTPGKILNTQKSPKAPIPNVDPIQIQKKINFKKTGTIQTSDLSISSKDKLSKKEITEIKALGTELKNYYFIPREINFGIFKNILYIKDAKPMTNAQKSYLVLIRHGESVWNAKSLWTGWTDVELSEKGHTQAKVAGTELKDIHFDIAYTSELKRAKQTWEEIRKVITPPNSPNIPTIPNSALNERDYGDLTGKNKWEIEKQFGEEQFMKWRRGWDDPIPNGESLKDVYNRVVPYYKKEILPKLKAGKNVIVSAHGNSLRALAKYLENVSDKDITKLEIPVGQILIYQIDEDGKVVSKEIRNQHENKV